MRRSPIKRQPLAGGRVAHEGAFPSSGCGARIEVRLSPEALKTTRRAAEIQGRSASDFVVAMTQAAAREVIAELEILRLLLRPSIDQGLRPDLF